MSTANEAAILNVVMYMDLEDVNIQDTWKLSTIINELGTIYNSPEGYETYIKNHKSGSKTDYEERQRQYQIIANACKSNEHLANMRIDNQSRLMNPGYQEGGLEACTFTDTNGKVVVAYRGTGAGEWIDNGEGLSGTVTASEQQKEATAYFDRIVKLNGYNTSNTDITITGHSKGGNKAQYVTMTSEYNDLIKQCYNFDGQGFSPEAIKAFKEKYGESGYLEIINKMYGFYAENDYVNPLGLPIVPEDHRTYFKSTVVNGIADTKKYHYFDDYLNIDGTFSEETKQGDLSKFVQTLSDNAMELPPEIRSKATSAIMGLMQKFLGSGTPVNGDSVSWMEYVMGTPVVIDTLGETVIDTANDKFGPVAELLTAAVLANECPILFMDDLIRVEIKDIKAIVKAAIDGLSKLVDVIVENIKKAGNKLLEFANSLGQALCKFASEVKKAWGKVKDFIGETVNNVINTGKTIINEAIKIKDKVTSSVSNFFNKTVKGIKNFISAAKKEVSNAWNSAVDKVSKGVRKIVEVAKSEIKEKYEAFKEGAHYLVKYAKKTLDNCKKGVSAISKFIKGIVRGKGTYLSGKLAVDLNRISDLQGKLKLLSSYFEESIGQILKEASRITSDVGRSYSEYYVQQQVRSIDRICDQINQSNRKICDALERKTKALQYALGRYSQIESKLSNQIIA